MKDVLVTGMALKLERVARNVKQGQLAARMGVSPSSLSRIEDRYAVNPDMAKRYRSALSTFPAVAMAQDGPEAA